MRDFEVGQLLKPGICDSFWVVAVFFILGCQSIFDGISRTLLDC